MKNTEIYKIILILLLTISPKIILSAEATVVSDSVQTNVEVEGLIFFGFEQREFRLIDTSEIYWIKEIPDSIHTIYQELIKEIPLKEQHLAVYIRAIALMSPAGSYGHFGGYKREIYLKKILNIRLATEEEKKSTFLKNE